MRLKLESISDILNSREWQSFQESIMSNLAIDDSERYERVMDAAEVGGDGSTHFEHICDWREFLSSLSCADDDDDAPRGDWITWGDYDAILAEIKAVEEWHDKNGSLHEMIG